ncbi:mechanosensitive ion channel family protein [Rurimicrobium arvi]|uniref:MscS family membrane protein n=1 Tax=Rurimicrobium arvi TaxID=2049916 RepID=A0ABP8MSJ2_9BACT
MESIVKAPFWQQQLFGVSIVHVVAAVFFLLLAALLRRYFARTISRVFFGIFTRIADARHREQFRSLLQKPMEGLLTSMLFFMALNQLSGWWENIILFERHKKGAGARNFISGSFSAMELIDHLFFLAFIFYFVFLLVRVISFLFFVWVEKAAALGDRERQQLLPLLRDVFAVLLWSFGFFAVLGVVFHVNVPTLIAGLGFGGVAVAFAAKESLENLLASFMIMVDKPFTIGDHIKIGSVEGRAEKIGFRSTRIRTMDKTLVSLPNKSLIGDSLENFSERGLARVRFKVSASYGLSQSNLRKIVTTIKEYIDQQPETNGDAHAFLEGFGPTLEILVTYYIKVPSEQPAETIKEDINYGIYQIMYQYGKGFGAPATISISGSGEPEVEL